MNNLIIYFFSYVITYLGFLLGKSTVEEHSEIKKYVLILADILKIIFLIILFYIYETTIQLLLIIGLFIFYIFTKYFDNYDLNKLFNILILSLSILFIIGFKETSNIYFIIILMFSIMLENSMQKFNLKEESYSIIIYFLIYLSSMFI